MYSLLIFDTFIFSYFVILFYSSGSHSTLHNQYTYNDIKVSIFGNYCTQVLMHILILNLCNLFYYINYLQLILSLNIANWTVNKIQHRYGGIFNLHVILGFILGLIWCNCLYATLYTSVSAGQSLVNTCTHTGTPYMSRHSKWGHKYKWCVWKSVHKYIKARTILASTHLKWGQMCIASTCKTKRGYGLYSSIPL